MKYVIVNNKEYDYDEIENEELLLFSVPENINIDNELLKKYLDEINIKCELTTYNIKVYNFKNKVSYVTDIYNILSNNVLMPYKRNDFIKWMEKYNIFQLPCEIL
jgi:hypothetical protein